MFKQFKLDKKFNEQKLIHSWESVMGKTIAVHTKEIHIRNKVLFLKLDSSVLRNELSYGKARIIEMMNEVAGTEVINEVVLS